MLQGCEAAKVLATHADQHALKIASCISMTLTSGDQSSPVDEASNAAPTPCVSTNRL